MPLTLLFCCFVYLTQECLWRFVFNRKDGETLPLKEYRKRFFRFFLFGLLFIYTFLYAYGMKDWVLSPFLLAVLILSVCIAYWIAPKLPLRLRHAFTAIFIAIALVYTWSEMSQALEVALFNRENCPPPPEGSKFSNMAVGVTQTFWTKLFGKFPICP